MEKLLLQEWFTRIGLASNIVLYYKGHIWDLQDFGEGNYFYDKFWWIESLNDIQKFFKEYTDDADFSLIAFDRYTNEILVYMTPIGTCSLYVNDQNLISPSINSLINYNSELDYQYLGLIRKFGYNQNDLTPYTNIKRLLPWFMYKGNINNFYFERTQIKIQSRKNTWFMLPLYLEESIQNRLLSIQDKVIWVLLSWWLDSSVIASLLLKVNENFPKSYQKKFRFFTTENAEDLKYAKEVAKFLNIKLEIIPWDDVELLDDELFEINETPVDLGSVVPNIKLFKRISSMWIHTVITWDGPDELFTHLKQKSPKLHSFEDFFLKR